MNLSYYFRQKGFIEYLVSYKRNSSEYFTDMLWIITELIKSFIILKTSIFKKTDNSKTLKEVFTNLVEYRVLNQKFERMIRLISILSIQTLESYINEVAYDNLSKNEFNIFEDNNLKSKWLFLPKLIK